MITIPKRKLTIFFPLLGFEQRSPATESQCATDELCWPLCHCVKNLFIGPAFNTKSMFELVFDRAQLLLLLHVKSLTTFVEGFSVLRTVFTNLSEFGLAPTKKWKQIYQLSSMST